MDNAEVQPIPVRFWWLKRIVIVCAIMLAGIIGLRVWWGWEAHRRLQAQIDEYIAAGQPIYPEDFDQEPVPDEENAAMMLDDALIALILTDEQDELSRDIFDNPGTFKQHLDAARRITDANGEALRLVRAARVAPGIDWGMKIRSPVFSLPLPGLSGHRRLSRALSIVTAYYHEIGDDEAAVGVLRDAIAHADALQHKPFLICHIVANTANGVCAWSVERLAPTLRVKVGSAASGENIQPATRASVEALVSALLAESPIKEGFARAMLGERMLGLDMMTQLFTSGSMPLGGGTRLSAFSVLVVSAAVKPAFELDTLYLLRKTTELAGSLDRPYQQAMAMATERPPSDTPWDRILNIVSAISLRWLERSVQLTYRTLAERQMAGIALAIRLYELDHGSRPVKLADLVPRYVPYLPPDPFADGRATFIYHPDADPPVLYSIGGNGTDDGGAFVEWYRDGDIPLFLNGVQPEPMDLDEYRAARSRKAAGDNQDEKDAEGNGKEEQPDQRRP